LFLFLSPISKGLTRRSDNGMNKHASNHTSNSATETVNDQLSKSVTWADVVKNGDDRGNALKRAATGQLATNRVFRETILSKQSSV
jgi:hypothetical protein